MSDTITWQAPQWLNDSEFVEKILKNYLQDDKVKIENIDFKPATANGENYASVMTRIKIYFHQGESEENIQNLSFIIKCCYGSDPILENLMKNYNLYKTEMTMYEHVLPEMSTLLQAADKEAANEQLFAKTLNVDYEKATIIFEDLSAKNYVMGNRLHGFDKLHAQFVMRKLAKFHAAAAVLNELRNGELQQFDRGLFNQHTRGLGCMFEYMIEECAKYALREPQLGKYYHDKLMKLHPHVVDYATEAYATNSPNHFYTLCHGDLWMMNIMVKYQMEDGGVDDKEEIANKILEDILFVDFQFSCWASPAIDLHYFFNTSLEPELQMDERGIAELVQLYHSNLSEMLMKLKYKGHIPTLRELRLQLEERKFLAVTGILSDQAIATSDQCDDADVHCLLGDSERARTFRQNCYKNKRQQKIVQHFLPYLDHCGLLDIQN
ncbi:uncharacterized protein LOC133328770 [Musca vetustissima]|uniref:uncharacterized protein LOC133328770 n=1 Tax=Musca vetustissima TaxID=27455 RepID=UPI002AB78C40|nr:uncharacterized protein LOC133328770 [Musca vetustissima]